MLKSPVSVRTRLTLWHVAIMTLVLSCFAVGIYGYVREQLFAQIDARLEEGINYIADSAKADINELAEAERHNRVLAFRVLDGDWPLHTSGGWVVGDLDSAIKPPGDARWIFDSPRGGIYHVKERTLTLDGRQLRISTAEQSEQVHRSLQSLSVTLLGGLPAAILLSLLGGYFLAGRALSPVAHLTARARAISADNLSERLTVPNPHDELGQLTAVLNDAFGRLEESFNRLKRFTQDAAHELRTPLAVLRSVGEVGLQEQRDPKAYRDVIGSMLEEVDRLGRLVEGLLTLASAEAGRFSLDYRPENLHPLCHDVVECLRVLADEKGQALTFDATGDAFANIDRDTLRLALINAIANAIRFTQPGGEICVRLNATGNEVTIEIEDNGPGIAIEHRAKVFDRFYRIDGSRAQQSGGTGLGLAITRWAVEANKGTISLAEKVSPGCLFRIFLPSARKRSASPA